MPKNKANEDFKKKKIHEHPHLLIAPHSFFYIGQVIGGNKTDVIVKRINDL